MAAKKRKTAAKKRKSVPIAVYNQWFQKVEKLTISKNALKSRQAEKYSPRWIGYFANGCTPSVAILKDKLHKF